MQDKSWSLAQKALFGDEIDPDPVPLYNLCILEIGFLPSARELPNPFHLVLEMPCCSEEDLWYNSVK